VEAGEKRCVGQNLDEEDEATFTLNIAETTPSSEGKTTDSMLDLIHAEVKGPDGNLVLEKTLAGNGRIIDFFLAAPKRGVYDMCFTALPGATKEGVVRVAFTVAYKNRQAGSTRLRFQRDGGAGDPSKKVAKEELPALEEMLQDAEETLAAVSKEIEFARSQEVMLLKAGDTANVRIQWFGWLSMAILVGTSLWQIVFLRHFFASKKLL
jgi:hypothetical protein